MNLPGYDQWKLMTPEDERDRHVRRDRRLWTVGNCDCCDAVRVPLGQTWAHGIETWACEDCRDA